ncbi:MAG: hypothetical protein EA362_02315 [Saprospirales bacterium]|nr:MAG: hypothetical protein EA362_02315 [Saprospirales bacterium]
MTENNSEVIDNKVQQANLEEVKIGNDTYFKISNSDTIRPFFMSVVSDANHWMFIGSNGGLTAGRKNPEFSLFPYYTVDKILESKDYTGPISIFHVHKNEEIHVWAPFSSKFSNRFHRTRNLYKSVYGNKVVFEEINHDLQLIFRYEWSFSKLFGFVRTTQLINESEDKLEITALDGLLNIMPFGVPSDLQRSASNLVDAYKRSELDLDSGLGIFSLSAIIVDKAEPSEALKANVVWSIGMDNPKYLLSGNQLKKFSKRQNVTLETDVKGEKGAYLICSDIQLDPGQKKQWQIIANVNHTQSQVVNLIQEIKQHPEELKNRIEQDIEAGTENLKQLVAASDGFQKTADRLTDSRHYSNVLFNIMRGGIFNNNYQIPKSDLINFLKQANKDLYNQNTGFLNALPENLNRSILHQLLKKTDNPDLIRLCMEYLPLKFSRRHGDPSRPWNNFTINTQDEITGEDILDYEGNWRDIFQNWEALALSYPEFIAGMIFKFLNASTFDGYNPYRVTKDGYDWETIEPDNPWSYIGYWGDHQIIYLLKFLEMMDNLYPDVLQSYFDKDWFVYAAVPYTINSYSEILKDSKNTIEFDEEWDEKLRERRRSIGADGTLLTSDEGEIYHVNFIEKILASVLAKISNLIPGGGIWMNTQRPEWNDANNALVGNGVSMVTLCYLHRFMEFFQNLLERSDLGHVRISNELIEFYHSVREALEEFSTSIPGGFSDEVKKEFLDRVGTAAADYRDYIYKNGFWGKKRSASLEGLKRFTRLSIQFIRHTIEINQRPDKLFHAYNLVSVSDNKLQISHLNEMLEGQVAALSSGFLSSEQAVEVLNALKESELFRPNQYSYLLYPNKDLPGFLEKNVIPAEEVESSLLMQKLISDRDITIVEKDVEGKVHFNGNFRNATDLKEALNDLEQKKGYARLVSKESFLVLEIFEKVFNHLAFTGRSGTFFAYEGLGSIYWHMVSKLHLAIQEVCYKAVQEDADAATIGRLLEHYYEIEAGIGSHKSPQLYGAFPTDPYSHTPFHRGAQQPGMTGQVKEDILVRFGELGLEINNGKIHFQNYLLRKTEFLQEEKTFRYFDIHQHQKSLVLQPGQLAFTLCNLPVIYENSSEEGISVHYANGKTEEINENILNKDLSKLIFSRTGKIEYLKVRLKIIR